jgi:hypothetical protein
VALRSTAKAVNDPCRKTLFSVEIVSFALAVFAIVLTISIEWLKRPKLKIKPMTWQASRPAPWTFAAVRIHNKPLPKLLRAIIVRSTAECCDVTLEFREPGRSHLAMPLVLARWSSHPEPLRSVQVSDDTGTHSFSVQYDPTIVPATKRLDVPAGDGGEEVAIAVQRLDGSASAFGAESYAFPEWRNPDWELKRQIYEVTVRARASGVTKSRRFTLDNLAPDFAKFSRLEGA